jgi:hypothetical protein
MKTKNKLIITAMALVAIITISLMATACKDGDEEEPTVRSSGTEVPLSFGTGCKITVKSNDAFINADWDKYCGQVAGMIKRGYDLATSGGKNVIVSDFGAGNTKAVILVNNLAHNWETKANEPGVLYIKTTSIDSIDSATDALDGMLDGTTSNG